MRQREELRTVLRKCLNGLGHGSHLPCAQIILMRVLTDQKRQLQVRKMLEQAFVPARRTLGTRWVITAILASPGITKSHGKNRDLSFIVEGRTIQLQPVAQAIAACIIPRYPTLMDLAPWRLTDDQKSSGVRQLYNGPRTERQFCLADPTSPNFAQQTFQRHRKAFSVNIHRVFRVRDRICFPAVSQDLDRLPSNDL